MLEQVKVGFKFLARRASKSRKQIIWWKPSHSFFFLLIEESNPTSEIHSQCRMIQRVSGMTLGSILLFNAFNRLIPSSRRVRNSINSFEQKLHGEFFSLHFCCSLHCRRPIYFPPNIITNRCPLYLYHPQ